MTRTLALVLIASLAACGAAAQHPEESISEQVRLYNEDLRWGRFEAAATHLPEKHRSDRIDEWDQSGKDLKITDFEIVRIDPRGTDGARAQVKVSWYLESEQILRETSAVELWERKGKLWTLVDEQRLRGHEMPGLREPLAHVRETNGSPPPPQSR